MSVDITHYFGIGVLLTNNPDWDLLDMIEEKYPQYSRYEFVREHSDIKTNIRLINDGMNGMYSYLMYVINEVEMEDMYSSKGTADFPIDNINMSDIIKELQEAYPIFNDNKELKISDIKFISLFHCS